MGDTLVDSFHLGILLAEAPPETPEGDVLVDSKSIELFLPTPPPPVPPPTEPSKGVGAGWLAAALGGGLLLIGLLKRKK